MRLAVLCSYRSRFVSVELALAVAYFLLCYTLLRVLISNAYLLCCSDVLLKPSKIFELLVNNGSLCFRLLGNLLLHSLGGWVSYRACHRGT